jgi:uncharacterized coiled-coil DUF342 family protein
MSYSATGADAWIAEQTREIERQHNEIIELNGRLADAIHMVNVLEIEKDNLASELIEMNSAKDTVSDYANGISSELDGLYRKVDRAIDSLRVLDEVPIRDLTASVGNIIEGLKA